MAKKIKKPTLEQIKIIHHKIIESSGKEFLELPKIKEGLIQSALDGIDQGFGNEAFYPTICDKAMHILRSIQGTQAFPDGNKRVALAATEYFLQMNRSQISNVSQKQKVDFVFAIANNTISKEKMVQCCITAIKGSNNS